MQIYDIVSEKTTIEAIKNRQISSPRAHRRAEGRGQRAEDRRRGAGGRGERAEDRRQKAGSGGRSGKRGDR